jgi:hypothetical protein
MLRKFKITGGIAVVVWVVVNIVFALSSWWRFDIPEWLGLSLYYAAFYVAPAALLVAIIGSIVCIVKSRLGK